MAASKRSEAAILLDNDLNTLQSTSKDNQFTHTEALKRLYDPIQADNARNHPDNPHPLRLDTYNAKFRKHE